MKNAKRIVFITLDCVRPDHLGCDGYQGVDTPNIDSIAQNGVIFEQAICQAPNTWVSLASIFTGCNPYKSGVRTPYHKLNANVRTIAEVLRDDGYVTAGFPGHTLVGSGRGFDRGFNFFDEDEEDFKYESGMRGFRFYRNWDSTFTKIKECLKSHKGQKLFLWIHYMETHWEPGNYLSLPKFYQEKYSPVGQFYDGKISYADEQCISSLFSLFKDLGIFDETIFVIFSDHGENLEEIELPGSGHNNNLFDSVMRIALIIKAPNIIPEGVKIKNIVSSTDIMPTVLDCVNIWSEVKSQLQYMDGISLLKICQSQENIINNRKVYIENIPKGYIGIRTEKFKLILHREVKRSIVSKLYGRLFKYLGGSKIIGTKLHAPLLDVMAIQNSLLNLDSVYGLYNLEADPGEKRDLSDEETMVNFMLLNELQKLLSNQKYQSDSLNPGERQKIEDTLRELGYL